uniref:Uncharacterized protein n=1 Tax=Eutreptiella gymnastica TaxID=73025 RepID=A0A7S1N0R5_9EUGL|mmetsp:Transcript_101693/g.175579  ORF Transcript_101693/g.175579 Transcript_101693/m.175579 type:complete len:178 (+) Transcript_101693:212-745(+)
MLLRRILQDMAAQVSRAAATAKVVDMAPEADTEVPLHTAVMGAAAMATEGTIHMAVEAAMVVEVVTDPVTAVVEDMEAVWGMEPEVTVAVAEDMEAEVMAAEVDSEGHTDLLGATTVGRWDTWSVSAHNLRSATTARPRTTKSPNAHTLHLAIPVGPLNTRCGIAQAGHHGFRVDAS